MSGHKFEQDPPIIQLPGVDHLIFMLSTAPFIKRFSTAKEPAIGNVLSAQGM